MAYYFSISEIKNSLLQEVGSGDFCQQFQKLQQEETELNIFIAPMDFIAFMNDKEQFGIEYKDKLLQKIFRHIQKYPHPLWNSFLCLLFWPMLENMFHQNYSWESSSNPTNFWSNIWQAFLQAVKKTLERPVKSKLILTIKMETFSRLHDLYEKEWGWEKFKSRCKSIGIINSGLPEKAWKALRQCLKAEGIFRIYSTPNGLRETTYYRLYELGKFTGPPAHSGCRCWSIPEIPDDIKTPQQINQLAEGNKR